MRNFFDSMIQPAKVGRLKAIGRIAAGVVSVIFGRLGSAFPSFRSGQQIRSKGGCSMAKPKLRTEFEPGRGYTKEDWNAVSENPEWTEKDFKKARPFAEVFPELAESIRRARGRPALENPKKQVTLRLDSEVVARFRAGGPGWQSRINEILRKAVGL